MPESRADSVYQGPASGVESGYPGERVATAPLIPGLRSHRFRSRTDAVDGAVARIPFAALPGKAAGTFLLEEVTIAIVPLPRRLLEYIAASARRSRVSAESGSPRSGTTRPMLAPTPIVWPSIQVRTKFAHYVETAHKVFFRLGFLNFHGHKIMNNLIIL